MRFINRSLEMARLDKAANSKEPALVVLWGRRRVGKTRILIEWVKKHKGVYWVADESSAPVQRRYFAEALGQHIPGFEQVEYRDWKSLFSRLAKDAKREKFRGPIAIDELPYLVQASPELPSILQHFVDHEAKEAGLLLALSGSSQRMMQDIALNREAPLFGRAKEIIKVSPMLAGHIGEALGLKDYHSMLEAYALWGGIPRYWELAADYGESILEAADNLVLDPMGPLHDEPHRLLQEESPSAVSLRPILDAIGLGAERMSDIASRLSLPATALGRPIARLRELDLITREFPYGESELGGKRTLYKIADPFLRFYFHAVAARRGVLAQASKNARKRWLLEAMPYILGQTWEDLCRKAIPRLSHVLGAEFGVASRYWHGKGPEWDLISETLDGNQILIGEAKFTTHEPTARFVYDAAQALVSKGIPPIKRKKDARLVYVLFLSRRPKERVLDLPGEVKIVDAKAVLTALK